MFQIRTVDRGIAGVCVCVFGERLRVQNARLWACECVRHANMSTHAYAASAEMLITAVKPCAHAPPRLRIIAVLCAATNCVGLGSVSVRVRVYVCSVWCANTVPHAAFAMHCAPPCIVRVSAILCAHCVRLVYFLRDLMWCIRAPGRGSFQQKYVFYITRSRILRRAAPAARLSALNFAVWLMFETIICDSCFLSVVIVVGNSTIVPQHRLSERKKPHRSHLRTALDLVGTACAQLCRFNNKLTTQ